MEIGVVEGGAEAFGGDAAPYGAVLAEQVEGEVAEDGEDQTSSREWVHIFAVLPSDGLP